MSELPQTTLVGWKAIAAHLGKDVRTAIRWRRYRSLPVRTALGIRGSVYAYSHELDAWLVGPDVDSSEVAGSPPAPAPIAAPPLPTPGPQPAWNLGRHGRVLLVVGASLIGLAAGILAWRAGDVATPARAALRAGQLSVWDGEDRLLWTRDFSPPPASGPSTLPMLRKPFDNPRVTDLDGDGRNEVLLVAPPQGADGAHRSRDELVCLESDGRARWRYRAERKLSFGGRVFDGPWYFSDVLVARRPRARSADVWLAVSHGASWPSFVVRLSAAGAVTPVLVNSGALYTLATLPNGGESLILAGGANEEYASASLAVVDANSDAEVASPQTPGTPQKCDGCARHFPLRYFVLPPSEVNRHSGGPHNVVWMVYLMGARVQVVTAEAPFSSSPWGFLKGTGTILYEMSNAQRLESYSMGDGYWDLHQHLEADGRVRHSIRECPEFVGPRRIREWKSGSGWTDQHIPVAPGSSWAGQTTLHARP